ncbi:uncharacterized protein F4812DRAFT_145426 [Daldinia caldariorum]|uniref:uncharacterized protein n=1 Tax=Daldinia caldariorum TaxID=326644 RepID=UPI0020080E5B|nr:uncharacterized protein F4812DRAFT_145426 [Daldinia caldariorum]KAI1464942.1 hypothetical protein F4812DRAFT_145426 [Daldinia caldariorum]
MGVYTLDRFCYYSTEYGAKSRSRFFSFLNNIEQLATPPLQQGLEEEQRFRIANDIFISFGSRHKDRGGKSLGYELKVPSTQLIAVLAAQYLIFEHFDEGGRYDLRIKTDPDFRSRIVCAVLSGVSQDPPMHPRAFAMLETIFKGGVSLNTRYKALIDGAPVYMDHLWYHTLRRIIFSDAEPYSSC